MSKSKWMRMMKRSNQGQGRKWMRVRTKGKWKRSRVKGEGGELTLKRRAEIA